MEKRRGVEVFIVRESGESANTARYAQTSRAKPEQAHTRPEAGKRAPFTRTYIILKKNIINISYLFLKYLKS